MLPAWMRICPKSIRTLESISPCGGRKRLMAQMTAPKAKSRAAERRSIASVFFQMICAPAAPPSSARRMRSTSARMVFQFVFIVSGQFP